MSQSIGVVVVTYYSEATIERCLRELLADRLVDRVVVVDNDSRDETVEIVHTLTADPRLSLFLNESNQGFAAACNRGASALSEPYVAFVNPDVFIGADGLSAALQPMADQPDVGMMGVEHRDESGAVDIASRRNHPELWATLLRRGDRSEWFEPRHPAEPVQDVDAVSGALMLMPTSLFTLIGGFDDEFLMHGEDLDLCRRVRQAGYRVVVANEVAVTHVRGVSSRTRPMWVTVQKHRGLWRYFVKHEWRTRTAWQRRWVAMGLIAHCLLECASMGWARLLQRVQQ